MNLVQYLTIFLMAQNVQSNTIGNRYSAHNSTRTDEEDSDTSRGVSTGDKAVVKRTKMIFFEETEEDLLTNNEPMTSSEILIRSISSPKFDSAQLSRVKRGRSPRKRKCDPLKPETCRKNKKKRRKSKGKKRCRRKGKGRKKGCRKSPKSPPKSTPINITIPSTPGREKCIRTTECPVGHCCARQHNVKICKPMKKEGDICTRPRRKNRRNVDRFEMCECEHGLTCKRSDHRNPRLFTCQPRT